MESRVKGPLWDRLRFVLLATGLAAMGLALWGHRVGLGGSGPMGRIRWLGLLAGLGVVLAGLLGRRIVDAHRATALIFLNTVLMIVGLELASAVALSIVGSPAAGKRVGWVREDADSPASSYYQTKPWGKAYWDEFELAYHHVYHPFYLWRTKPFGGRFIRVDSAGLRETPGAQCAGGAYRVSVFGGSTVWGMGSPDSGTIPAHLQSILSDRLRRPVCVVNFGQLGFTTAQDVVQLESELRAGNIPDLALFYGGVNDITTAFVFGRTGVHFNMLRMATAFERMRQPKPGPSLFAFVRQSNAYRLAAVLKSGPDTALIEGQERYFESDSLADAVVATFASNHRQADVLGRGYGFTVAFFWQPSVSAGAKVLTEEERRSFDRERVTGFTARAYERAEARLPGTPGRYYLGNVFASERGLVFVDSHHLTPEANRTVAQAMVDRLRHTLPDPPRARAEAPGF